MRVGAVQRAAYTWGGSRRTVFRQEHGKPRPRPSEPSGQGVSQPTWAAAPAPLPSHHLTRERVDAAVRATTREERETLFADLDLPVR